jgi:4-carboxymuconolactone decarboxylase
MHEVSLDALDPDFRTRIAASVGDVLPELAAWIANEQFEARLKRPLFDPKTRLLLSLAALTAVGDAKPQLQFHVRAAVGAGATSQEIFELFYQLMPVVGVPRTVNAIAAAKAELAQPKGHGA